MNTRTSSPVLNIEAFKPFDRKTVAVDWKTSKINAGTDLQGFCRITVDAILILDTNGEVVARFYPNKFDTVVQPRNQPKREVRVEMTGTDEFVCVVEI